MDMSKLRLLSCIGLLALVSPLCHADNLSVFASGGVSLSRLDNEKAVTINNFVVNDYNASVSNAWNIIGGIGIIQTYTDIFDHVDFGVGFIGLIANLGTVNGTELPFASSSVYDTLNYSFEARSVAVMLESRLIYNDVTWQPYIFGGIGAASNRLSNYRESPAYPALSAATVPEVFSSHSQRAWAYEAGVGVQRQISAGGDGRPPFVVMIDYRYLNFGSGELGSFPAQIGSDRLQVNNLTTQAIMLTLQTCVG